MKMLLIQDGINGSRLDISAFGEKQPKYDNSQLTERKKNRRVIISVNMEL